MAISTGTAILGGALISGAASALSSRSQSKAADKAANVSEKQYAQTREDLAPWRGIGSGAIKELGALYNIGESGPIIDSTAREVPTNWLARMGRGGDTEVGHLTTGEIVVPKRVARIPEVDNALKEGFLMTGMDAGRYTVGGADDSVNPRTGAREYFDPSQDQKDRQSETSYDGNPRDAYDGEGGSNALRVIPTAPVARPGPKPIATTRVPNNYFTQDAAIERFYQSPDYRLAFDEGADTIERSAAGRGGLFSGNTGTALMKYGMDYGGNLYTNYFNKLAALSGLGQNAAAQTGNFGAQAAGQQGNAMIYGGQARAGTWEGVGNAINSGLSNYLLYDYLNRGAA